MATVIQNRPRSFGKILADSLGEEAKLFRQGQINQQKIQQQRKSLERMGLDPDLANISKELASPIIKEALKPQTWGELFRGLLGGQTSRPGQLGFVGQQGQQGQQQNQVNIGGQQIPTQNLSPQAKQALQQQQVQQQAEEQGPTSLARLLGSSAVSLGVPLAASAIGPAAFIGSGVSAGLDAGNFLGKKAGAEENILPEFSEVQEQLGGFGNKLGKSVRGGVEESLREKGITPKERPPVESTQLPFFPTISEVSEAIRQGGDELGLPLRAKNRTEKYVNDIAEVVGYLGDPSQWTTKMGTIKNLTGALGAAIGGDSAGYVTEQLTGNKLAGNVVRGSTYALYSLFPGLLGKMSEKNFQKVNSVIKVADEEGMLISGNDFANKYGALESRVNKELTAAGEAKAWMENELAKTDSLYKGPQRLTPSQLNEQTISSVKLFDKVPGQAKELHQELIKLNRELLGKNLNKVQAGSSKALTDAYSLATDNFRAKDAMKGVLDLSSPRKSGLAAAALFAGGYKSLVGLAAGGAGYQYLKKFLGNKAVRDSISQLAKARGANNAGMVEAIMSKLDRQIEQTLRKMPKKEAEEVRRVIKESSKTSPTFDQI